MQHLRTSGLAREHRDLNHFVRARSGRDATGCGPRRTIVTDSTARNETMGVGIKEQVLPPLNTDRKSTRLNSSHGYISYAVFCLKKKKKQEHHLATGSEHTLRG